MDEIIKDRYLGDGVYASYDGYQMTLDLRGQGDAHVRIAIDESVYSSLEMFHRDCMDAREAYAARKAAEYVARRTAERQTDG